MHGTEDYPTMAGETALDWPVDYPATGAWPIPPVQPEPRMEGWTIPLIAAAAAVFIGAGVVGVGLKVADHGISASATTTASVPSSSIDAPAPTLPVSLPPVPDADQVAQPDEIYLSMIRHGDLRITDAAKAISLGHAVCQAMTLNPDSTADQVVAALRQEYVGLTQIQASAIVHGAQAAYCREFLGR